jgi:hypothetical protein
MLYVGGVLVAFCLALCVIAVAWAAHERPRVGEGAIRRTERVREEDLVRPAHDVDGQPSWVTADEVVWHEIVHAPVPKADASQKRRRTA